MLVDLKKGLSIKELTKLGKKQFIGLVIESYVVRILNSNSKSRKLTYNWIMNTGKSLSDDEISKIMVIGKGALYSKKIILDEYNPASKMDIIFAKEEEGIVKILSNNKIVREASIQVKAGKSDTYIKEIAKSLSIYTNYILRRTSYVEDS